MSPTRNAAYPNVPTMVELGYNHLVVMGWTGLMAPARTPPDIVARIDREVGRILAREDVKQAFTSAGFEANYRTSVEFGNFIASDMALFTGVAGLGNVEKK